MKSKSIITLLFTIFILTLVAANAKAGAFDQLGQQAGGADCFGQGCAGGGGGGGASNDYSVQVSGAHPVVADNGIRLTLSSRINYIVLGYLEIKCGIDSYLIKLRNKFEKVDVKKSRAVCAVRG